MFFHYFCTFSFIVIALVARPSFLSLSQNLFSQLALREFFHSLSWGVFVAWIGGVLIGSFPIFLYFWRQFKIKKWLIESVTNKRLIFSWIGSILVIVLFLFRFISYQENQPDSRIFFSLIPIQNKLQSDRLNRYENFYNFFLGRVDTVDGFKKNRFRLTVQLEKIQNPQNQTVFSFDEFNSEVFVFLYSYLKMTNIQEGDLISFRPSYFQETLKLDSSGYQDYLLHQNILGSGYLTGRTARFDLIQPGTPPMIKKIWNYMEFKINRYITSPSSGLTYSLLTGNKNNLDESLKENFRRTGTYHVLAVSGMHAMFLTVFFFYFFRLLGLRRNVAMWLILLLVLPAYLFLTDFQISIVRTYLMGVAAFVLSRVNRQVNLLAILSLTFMGVLYHSPFLIYSVSFQLSFSAVFGIGLVINFIKSAKIKNRFLQGLMVSVGAQGGTLAFIIYYFGYVNFFTLFYNLVVSFLICIFYFFSLIFFFVPFDFYSELTGTFLSQLGSLIDLFLKLTRFDLEWYEFPKAQNNLLLAIFIFLVFFTSMQIAIFFLDKVSNKDIEKNKN